jgi:hypothetical protein
MIKENAPIVLFVYKRPRHTRQIVEALKKNELAGESDLFIYSDGPKNAHDQDKVKEVRNYIRTITGFKEISIIERKENWGLAESIIDGVTNIVNTYGKIIVLEDDIKTAKGFLKFMNEVLELYSANDKVFGVSGFKYPSNTKIDENTYFLPIGSSWGWGTWKNKWDCFKSNAKELKDEIDEQGLSSKMNFNGYPFYEMLENQVSGKVDSWAIRFYASFLLEGGYFLFPNKSLVQNIGFDESASHTKGNSVIFSKVETEADYVGVNKRKVVINKSIAQSVRLNPTKIKRFISKIKRTLQ